MFVAFELEEDVKEGVLTLSAAVRTLTEGFAKKVDWATGMTGLAGTSLPRP